MLFVARKGLDERKESARVVYEGVTVEKGGGDGLRANQKKEERREEGEGQEGQPFMRCARPFVPSSR